MINSLFDPGRELLLRYIDGRHWEVMKEFYYLEDEADRCVVMVPSGFITDFASVPRVLWSILPPTGNYGLAAVIHDYLYRTGKAVINGEAKRITREHADSIFREAMKDEGVGRFKRYLIWSGVRSGGSGIWDRWRAQDDETTGTSETR